MAPRSPVLVLGVLLVIGAGVGFAQTDVAPPSIRLMTLDPGHFHAGLVHRESYPGVSPQVDVYAPLGSGPSRPSQTSGRLQLPAPVSTDWRVDVHTGPDFFSASQGGARNVVVISDAIWAKIDSVQGWCRLRLQCPVDSLIL